MNANLQSLSKSEIQKILWLARWDDLMSDRIFGILDRFNFVNIERVKQKYDKALDTRCMNRLTTRKVNTLKALIEKNRIAGLSVERGLLIEACRGGVLKIVRSLIRKRPLIYCPLGLIRGTDIEKTRIVKILCRQYQDYVAKMFRGNHLLGSIEWEFLLKQKWIDMSWITEDDIIRTTGKFNFKCLGLLLRRKDVSRDGFPNNIVEFVMTCDKKFEWFTSPFERNSLVKALTRPTDDHPGGRIKPQLYVNSSSVAKMQEDMILSSYDIHALFEPVPDAFIAWACRNGRVSAIRKLVTCDGNINFGDSRALAIACAYSTMHDLSYQNKLADIIDVLLECGCDPSANDSEALRWIAISGNMRIAERLLDDDRTDVSANDHEAVKIAYANGHYWLFKELRQKLGSDVPEDLIKYYEPRIEITDSMECDVDDDSEYFDDYPDNRDSRLFSRPLRGIR